MQSQLESSKTELGSAKQAADQEKARIAELEERAAKLTSELQTAHGQRIDLQAKLDQANAEIKRLNSELQQAGATQEGTETEPSESESTIDR